MHTFHYNKGQMLCVPPSPSALFHKHFQEDKWVDLWKVFLACNLTWTSLWLLLCKPSLDAVCVLNVSKTWPVLRIHVAKTCSQGCPSGPPLNPTLSCSSPFKARSSYPVTLITSQCPLLIPPPSPDLPSLPSSYCLHSSVPTYLVSFVISWPLWSANNISWNSPGGSWDWWVETFGWDHAHGSS